VDGNTNGATCSTGGGGCPTIGGIPIQLPILVLVLIWTLAGGGRADDGGGVDPGDPVRRGMAAFEGPYIAALWSTGNESPERAVAAVARTSAAWSAFMAEQGEALSSLRGGDAAVTAVAARIEEAVALAPDAPREAHEALEGVRLRLRELRVANGIAYFPDHLTAYHGPMEAIVLAGKSGEADGVATIRATFPAVRAAWSDVESAPSQNDLFGFSAAERKRREELLAAGRSAVDALAAALEAGDPGAIRAAAVALKPPFARLVLLYGDDGDG
jgi:hypothetical protein